ncbi:MAG: hypothetical protein H0W96_05630 [Solirubrobacterales bacterium]|nr:hypothetical protein [Solirubrobacterales bacterium]
MNANTLRSEKGSAMITALMVMLIMLPLGLALLSIVDTQARDSGSERTRDRAFNLADSAMSSAAVAFSRYSWPSSAASAPNDTGTSAQLLCGADAAAVGATLGETPAVNSTTARLQPNLNASYDDSAYTGAAWKVQVCDDELGVATQVWSESILQATDRYNWDRNGNGKIWIRSEAIVGGRTRALAGLAQISTTSPLASKYGLMTGRLNAELSNSLGAVLTGSVLSGLASTLLGTDPLVAPDSAPAYTTTPPSSGITAVRCGALDGCLTGALGGASNLTLVQALVTGGKLVQATSKQAIDNAAIEQLKQQAINSGTYVAETAGSASATSSAPPPCTIPAGANADTVVYIEKVGTGALGTTTGGVGDQFCRIDLSTANVAFKALVIGHGRVVLRGDNTSTAVGSGTKNTFSGVVYAANQQREALGDDALPTREVIRLDRGAHVNGGVAADGKSAQVGIYPPPLCTVVTTTVLGITTTVDGCVEGLLPTISGVLATYNPAIQSNVALMNAVKVNAGATLVPGTYVDVAGEQQG